ncbi:MAG: type III-A CRISPR-associated RAMP protein Csm3 [Clostridia bacterium]|nr:type III-A CRISPR-associated RAMP protein Csm3 [Clostridia bacterium]
MFAKIRIACTLKVLTGLHIGDSNGFSAIGALDNPVIRDAYTGDPMIPGSSLKGKMRTLLARSRSDRGTHLPSCDNDAEEIKRLFGTPGNKGENPRVARLQFSDAFLTNREQLLRRGGITEVKSENTITRSTSIANPRSMERVVRGAEFAVEWFYTMDDEKDLMEDMKLLAEACRLLSLDYLGGSGTRGYGRVAFEGFSVETLLGEIPVSQDALNACFEDVNGYAAHDL